MQVQVSAINDPKLTISIMEDGKASAAVTPDGRSSRSGRRPSVFGIELRVDTVREKELLRLEGLKTEKQKLSNEKRCDLILHSSLNVLKICIVAIGLAFLIKFTAQEDQFHEGTSSSNGKLAGVSLAIIFLLGVTIKAGVGGIRSFVRERQELNVVRAELARVTGQYNALNSTLPFLSIPSPTEQRSFQSFSSPRPPIDALNPSPEVSPAQLTNVAVEGQRQRVRKQQFRTLLAVPAQDWKDIPGALVSAPFDEVERKSLAEKENPRPVKVRFSDESKPEKALSNSDINKDMFHEESPLGDRAKSNSRILDRCEEPVPQEEQFVVDRKRKGSFDN
jgi:hypothetical protein